MIDFKSVFEKKVINVLSLVMMVELANLKVLLKVVGIYESSNTYRNTY